MRIKPKVEHPHLVPLLETTQHPLLDDALGPACTETLRGRPNHRAAMGLFLAGHVRDTGEGSLVLTLERPQGEALKRHGTTRARFESGLCELMRHTSSLSTLTLKGDACGPTAPAWVWLVEPGMDANTRALAVAVAMLGDDASWEERAKYAGLGAMALRTARHKLRAWEVA